MANENKQIGLLLGAAALILLLVRQAQKQPKGGPLVGKGLGSNDFPTTGLWPSINPSGGSMVLKGGVTYEEYY